MTTKLYDQLTIFRVHIIFSTKVNFNLDYDQNHTCYNLDTTEMLWNNIKWKSSKTNFRKLLGTFFLAPLRYQITDYSSSFRLAPDSFGFIQLINLDTCTFYGVYHSYSVMICLKQFPPDYDDLSPFRITRAWTVEKGNLRFLSKFNHNIVRWLQAGFRRV